MSFHFPPVPKDLIKVIADSRKINVVSHINADGDCVFSSFAIKRILEKAGKEVYLSNAGPFSYEVLSHKDSFLDHLVPEADLILVVDCSAKDRIGYLADEISSRPVAVIDHHGSGNQFGDYRYIVPESPSTTLLILQVLKALPNAQLDNETANYLFNGFVTDSGFFHHLHTDSGEFIRSVAELADQGVDIGAAYNEMFGHKDFRMLRFMAEVISSTRFFFGGKLAVGIGTQEQIDRFGSVNSPSDMYYAQLSFTEGLDSIIYLEPRENGSKTKIGFRSVGTSTTDVGKIAHELGGGGHFHAAGATVEMSMEETVELLIKRFAEEYNS